MKEALQSVNQNTISSVEERLFVALDYPNATNALTLAKQLAPLNVSFKVGMQLFYAEGASIVQALQNLNPTPKTNLVFVDLKLHDIPNTVAGAVSSLVCHGVNFLNVHVQGGALMMRTAVTAAHEAADRIGKPSPKL